MKRAKYGRGDIVRLNLNPTAGREHQGWAEIALVLTPAAYNATGLAVIAALEAECERLREALGRILENEASDYKAAEEFGGYVLDDELREEARAALGH